MYIHLSACHLTRIQEKLWCKDRKQNLYSYDLYETF
jgi:hypothetical protein